MTESKPDQSAPPAPVDGGSEPVAANPDGGTESAVEHSPDARSGDGRERSDGLGGGNGGGNGHPTDVPPRLPPPWERVPADAGSNSPPAWGGTDTSAEPATARPDQAERPERDSLADARTVSVDPRLVGISVGGGSSGGGFGAAPASSSPPGGFPAAWPRNRRPRQANLQLKRLDPWSVLKIALVLSVVLYLVWMVAVGVLYGALDGIGVWERLNGQYSDLVAEHAGDKLISAGRVFGFAAVVGAVNSLLVAVAFSVAAFIYNVSADLVGGIEVTLSERD